MIIRGPLPVEIDAAIPYFKIVQSGAFTACLRGGHSKELTWAGSGAVVIHSSSPHGTAAYPLNHSFAMSNSFLTR